MRRCALVLSAALSSLSLTASGSAAQAFTVQRSNIGGDGGTDYLLAEPGTGRVFISRGTHVVVVDGPSGRVLGDIAGTPRVHGIALAPASGHGFTTNGGDSTVTMFDLRTLAVIRKVPVPTGGLDGIMYDDFSRRIILTNHSRPHGTVVALDPASGAIVGTAELEDDAPEGAASDGQGRLYVNNEGTSTIQVLEDPSLRVVASWPLAPCEGPTGIAYDRTRHRLFSGCGRTSVVLDPANGKVVATIANGDGVDALGWDPAESLIYLPAGRDSSVTVARVLGPDRYAVIATVPTGPGAKTITVDTVGHVAYLFQPEYGPLPTGTPAPAPGQRPPRGPVVAGWFYVIRHTGS